MDKKIYAVVIFIFIFMVGFHNTDNCRNMSVLNMELKDYNITYGENNLFLKNIRADTCYAAGIDTMLGAFIFMVWLALAK